MSTFSAKGSDIDVEAIMANIRKKIEEKRKGLYTEEEVREIAEMQLDAILDSNQFNSDFVAAFRARDEQWNYTFTPETIYASSRGGGGGLIRSLRGLLNPVLKLFFNPNPVISALSRQSDLNRYYVLMLHNMTTEMTRLNLEFTNLKARLRTLGVRVDFQTKREKTFEQLATASRESREAREPRESREPREPRESRPSREQTSRESSSASSSADGRRRGRGSGGRRPYRRRRGGKPNGGRGGDSGSRDGGGGSGGGGSK
jgi:hypothetical protein